MARVFGHFRCYLRRYRRRQRLQHRRELFLNSAHLVLAAWLC